jgi:hypothetical protein
MPESMTKSAATKVPKKIGLIHGSNQQSFWRLERCWGLSRISPTAFLSHSWSNPKRRCTKNRPLDAGLARSSGSRRWQGPLAYGNVRSYSYLYNLLREDIEISSLDASQASFGRRRSADAGALRRSNQGRLSSPSSLQVRKGFLWIAAWRLLSDSRFRLVFQCV